MSVLLKEFILRILCTGIVCTAALILAGEGTYREPVRICCASIFIIVIFAPYKGRLPDLSDYISDRDQVEEFIADETAKAEAVQYDMVLEKIEAQAEAQLAEIGVTCSVKIGYSLHNDSFEISSVYIDGRIENQGREQVFDLFKKEYGVDRSVIAFSEE